MESRNPYVYSHADSEEYIMILGAEKTWTARNPEPASTVYFTSQI